MEDGAAGDRLVYVGIDEAGYGPRLGPLCVAMAAFEAQPDVGGAVNAGGAPCEAAPDLWKRLSRMVSRDPAKAKRGRLAINDSKRLKLANSSKSVHPLVHLESGVLTILLTMGRRVDSDAALWDVLGVDLRGLRWYAGEPIAAPVSTTEERLGTLANSFRNACAKGGVHPLDMQCRTLSERDFNAALRTRGVKSAVSFELVAELLRRAWDRWGRRGALVAVDRQGGRIHYREALEAALPGTQAHVIEEGPRASRYVVRDRCGERRLRIDFEVECDGSHLPTAVASMTAKLVRESAMARFNRHWMERMPEVKPTAGYGADARRWIEQMRAALSEEERTQLVRSL